MSACAACTPRARPLFPCPSRPCPRLRSRRRGRARRGRQRLSKRTRCSEVSLLTTGRVCSRQPRLTGFGFGRERVVQTLTAAEAVLVRLLRAPRRRGSQAGRKIDLVALVRPRRLVLVLVVVFDGSGLWSRLTLSVVGLGLLARRRGGVTHLVRGRRALGPLAALHNGRRLGRFGRRWRAVGSKGGRGDLWNGVRGVRGGLRSRVAI